MYNDPEPWKLMGWHYLATREDANRIQEAWNACPENIDSNVSQECLAQLLGSPKDAYDRANLREQVREHFELVKRAEVKAKQVIEEVLGRSITVSDQFG
jgi:hypothetical protein